MTSDDTTSFKTTAPPPRGATAMEVDDGRGRGRNGLLVLLWSALLSVAVFLPLLTGRGVALVGDMIFVPHQPIKGAWLGLDGGTTGAVPADFLVSLATAVLPGDLLQKVVLVVIVLLAGTGAGAAVSNLGLAPRLAAATLFVWNPLVFERLAVGDWTFLVSYSMLPWIVWGARRVHTGALGEWAPVVAFMALAGWMNPVGGLLALLLAVILVARRNARAGLMVLGAGIVVNLPTILPALLRRGGATVDPASAEAYALSTEGGLGVFGNLLTLGGIWDPTAAAPGRDQLIVVLLALVLTAAAIAGAVLLARRADGGIVGGIGLLAVVGLVIALLGAFDGTRGVLASLAESVPGGSLLVDGQAWLAPLALFLAVGLAGLVAEAAARVSGSAAVAAVGLVAVAAPIALLPGLALGLDGRLENVRIPGGWWAARGELLAADPEGVLVLPLTSVRDWDWNDARETADPAPRYFFGDVVIDDSRTIDGVEVAGTDPRVEEIRAALDGGLDELTPVLASSGIDTILIERNTGGEVPALQRTGAESVYDGAYITVWSLAEPTTGEPDQPPAILIILADILAGLVALGAVLAWVVLGRRRHDEVEPAYATGGYPTRDPGTDDGTEVRPTGGYPTRGPGTDEPTEVRSTGGYPTRGPVTDDGTDARPTGDATDVRASDGEPTGTYSTGDYPTEVSPPSDRPVPPADRPDDGPTPTTPRS